MKVVLPLIGWPPVPQRESRWLWVARSEPQRWAWAAANDTELMRRSVVTLQFSPARPSFLRDVPPRGHAPTPQELAHGIRGRASEARSIGPVQNNLPAVA